MSLERLEQRDRAAELADARMLSRRLVMEVSMAGDVDSSTMGAEVVARAFAHGRAVATHQALGLRTCRVCGCIDALACEGGCCWVGEDLCSTCAGFGGEGVVG